MDALFSQVQLAIAGLVVFAAAVATVYLTVKGISVGYAFARGWFAKARGAA